MTTMMFRGVSLLALCTILAACDDDRGARLTGPQTPSSGSVAWLSVSDLHAATGSVVTVTAIVRGAAGVANVGAFTARLAYDASGLSYQGESELPGMRALNPRAGAINVAGASAEGFADGCLFAVRFKVLDAAALSSLALNVSELSGVDFGSSLRSLRHERRVFGSSAR